ncbi:MAG TPA: hypothetical protein VFQ77_02335 [Pseudonocardiaceae bacterium]|nr:hypothetical protein [Pseudonocardiaceae bacterium]
MTGWPTASRVNPQPELRREPSAPGSGTAAGLGQPGEDLVADAECLPGVADRALM